MSTGKTAPHHADFSPISFYINLRYRSILYLWFIYYHHRLRNSLSLFLSDEKWHTLVHKFKNCLIRNPYGICWHSYEFIRFSATETKYINISILFFNRSIYDGCPPWNYAKLLCLTSCVLVHPIYHLQLRQ